MPLARPTPAASRPRFHPLRVTGVERLTPAAVAVSFAVPAELAATFDFAAGQYLTLRASLGGADVRRSYSICVSPRDARARGEVRVAASRVDGGAMSNWLNDSVRVGDVIGVLPPLGSLTTPPGDGPRHHAAIAAGSGITPVLSIITAALQDTDADIATLVLGNRAMDTVTFRAELDDLALAYPDRFRLVHVLTRPAATHDDEAIRPSDGPGAGLSAQLRTGRLDEPRIAAIIDALGLADDVDEWYLAGPIGVVESAREVLTELGIGPARVHEEIFYVPPPSSAPPAPPAPPASPPTSSEVAST